jgi:hypothetical protein
MDRFIATLKGYSDERRGETVLNAHLARLRLDAKMSAPPQLFLSPSAARSTFVSQWRKKLAIARRQATRDGDSGFADGLDVWMRSLDAVLDVALKARGQLMWSLLAHGFADAKTRAREECATNDGLDPSRLQLAIESIPGGLEPRDENGHVYMPGVPGVVVLRRLAEFENEAREGAAEEPSWSQIVERLTTLRENLRVVRGRYGLPDVVDRAA